MMRREFIALMGASIAWPLSHPMPYLLGGSSVVGGGIPVGPVFPIQAQANSSFLQTAGGKPFLLMADSAHAMLATQDPPAWNTYLATRVAQGFNAVNFSLVTWENNTGNSPTWADLHGNTPFTGKVLASSLGTAYWARADQLISLIGTYGLLAIVNPFQTGDTGESNPSTTSQLISAGSSSCQIFGATVGARYANSPNVLWYMGDDFDPTQSAGSAFTCMQSMITGLVGADPNHLISAENYYQVPSSAFDSSNYGSNKSKSYGSLATAMGALAVNSAYTYAATYVECMACYNKSSVSFAGFPGTNTSIRRPAFLAEANYENLTGAYGETGSPINLRRQFYWAMLAGMTGQMYGNLTVVQFASGWPAALSTTGVTHTIIAKNFFSSLAWYNLVPDQTHVIGTAGFGTAQTTPRAFATDTYVSLAASTDGRLAVAYFSLGNASSLTVNMASFAGLVTAQWFDPTNAVYSSIASFSNTGTHVFTPGGNNSAGDADWVLLLTA
jgi:hypothetical protein